MTPTETRDELLARVAEFEEFARQVVDEVSLQGFHDDHHKRLVTTGYKWNLNQLFDALQDRIDVDHLRLVMDAAMDTKLQLMYLTDLRFGLADFEWAIEQSGQRAARPALFRLRKLASLQDEIGKIRVFWERFMCLVYALETGKSLHSNKWRNKKRFFKEIPSRTHWKWLEPYEAEIDGFDEKFRTPEFHKASVLRARLADVGTDFQNDILQLLGHAMNQLWDNLILIAGGERDPSRFSYGMVHHDRETGAFDQRRWHGE